MIKKLKSLRIPLLVMVITDQDPKRYDPGPMKDDLQNFHLLEVGKIESGLKRL